MYKIRKNIIIKRVDENSELKKDLIKFIKNFSWVEVKEHALDVVVNWKFEDWETPFVAIIDGKIVGMVEIMKTDYYPIIDIFPWITCVFVTEEYRGNRISEMMIDFANEYAKELGFKRTYIPTDIVGLYEKFGYFYIKDIVNYGNGIDRLYVKELL